MPRRLRLRRRYLSIAMLLAMAPLGAGAQETITGTVSDSVAGAPLAGAVIQVASPVGEHATFSAVTDSAGRYVVRDVPPGRYVVGFVHDRLTLLGLASPARTVMVREGAAARADLAIASPATIHGAVCGRAAADSSGLVLGRVRDAGSGTPLAGADVTLSWSETVLDGGQWRGMRRGQTVRSDAEGRFALCGVPTDVSIALAAVHDSAASGLVVRDVPALGLAVQELRVGVGTAVAADDSVVTPVPLRRGAGGIVGSVHRANGDAFRSAVVGAFGSTARDTTRDDGRFTLTGLAPGTTTLEVRAIGFTPTRATVDVPPGGSDTVAITLAQPIPELERVTVFGKQGHGHELMDEFLHRREVGWGRYLTQAEIERHPAFDIFDLLRGLPGVRVVSNGAFDETVLIRNCVPNVFLDGRSMRGGATDIGWMVSPSELAGIEVYSSAIVTPPQFLEYRSTSGSLSDAACGAVVVWTKAVMY